jgi:hypothetical protein
MWPAVMESAAARQRPSEETMNARTKSLLPAVIALVTGATSLLAAIPACATTFVPGEFVTGSQIAWGHDPTSLDITAVLVAQFGTVYAATGGLLTVGLAAPAGHSMVFDSGDSIVAFLPQNGTVGVLTATLLDPTSSSAGALGGSVVALALNIAFSDAGLLAHPAGVSFGDLEFTGLENAPGLTGPLASLDGMTVRDLLSAAEVVVGGGASPFSPIDMWQLVEQANQVFNVGTVPPDDLTPYLEIPSTAVAVPEPPTWPMLLIGFAILGFGSCTLRGRSTRIAGRNFCVGMKSENMSGGRGK